MNDDDAGELLGFVQKLLDIAASEGWDFLPGLESIVRELGRCAADPDREGDSLERARSLWRTVDAPHRLDEFFVWRSDFAERVAANRELDALKVRMRELLEAAAPRAPARVAVAQGAPEPPSSRQRHRRREALRSTSACWWWRRCIASTRGEVSEAGVGICSCLLQISAQLGVVPRPGSPRRQDLTCHDPEWCPVNSFGRPRHLLRARAMSRDLRVADA